ncbi:MAG: hypothetical protein P1U88_12475 [Thalassobaculaceae bacterium]|nr:hypothetical protein [Thalassobaculaceae bacterium]
MKILIPLVIFAGLIALAARMTLRQFRLDRLAAPASDPAAGGIVAAADAAGKFHRVSDGIDEMYRSWHPVRFPSGWESRGSGGFPEEKVYSDTNMILRRDWCREQCAQPWRVEVVRGSAPVFWFESAHDAREFTYTWFPFKCS